jgi:hypothetical protein
MFCTVPPKPQPVADTVPGGILSVCVVNRIR